MPGHWSRLSRVVWCMVTRCAVLHGLVLCRVAFAIRSFTPHCGYSVRASAMSSAKPQRPTANQLSSQSLGGLLALRQLT